MTRFIWASRMVLFWRLSNTLGSMFCIDVLEEAIDRYGCPDIFNTDQGSQFSPEAFTGMLISRGIAISMDGKGRLRNNVFIERLWKSVKYEDSYLKACDPMAQARKGFPEYFLFYNQKRRHKGLHSGLNRKTPAMVYFNIKPHRQAAA